MVMSFWNLSNRQLQAAKLQRSLRHRAVSQEPSQLAHTEFWLRWRLRIKFKHLALLDSVNACLTFLAPETP